MKKLSDLPDIDKPREKLANRGVQALSNHELLMVLLGSGLPGRDVSALATDILKVIEAEQGNITLEKLTQVQGIGTAKASQILA